MGKIETPVRKQNRVNLENLSQRDLDILTLDTKEVMNKYNLEKQPVYDRRFALNRKIKAAGFTLDQIVNKTAAKEAPKRGRPKKTPKDKTINEPVETFVEETESNLPTADSTAKQVPIVMKPIEITFDNFSIKLNGVPRKISVNPDTNAIEIDV